jgi:chromosome segregation ATPase
MLGVSAGTSAAGQALPSRQTTDQEPSFMSHPSATAAVFGLALLAATIAPLPAHAQADSSHVATRDELRACLDGEDSLKAKRADLEARAKQNTEDATAINKEGEELKEEQKRAEDSTLPMARDRVERRIRQYQAKVKAAKEKEDGVRAGLEDLKKAIDQHNTQCKDLKYRAEDKEAIEKERASKGK